MIKKGLIVFFVMLIGALAFVAHAQLQVDDISLSVSPEYPSPNSNVTASVSTFSTNLNNAKISWMLDGNLSLEGVGKRTFSFTTGSTGVSSTLEVIVETANSGTISKQMIITPSSTDLLWEAYGSYAPPFYKGKKLGTGEGMYKVVAMPSTKNPLGYSYSWKLDGTVKQGSSGYEKNFYVFKKSYLDSVNEVDVTLSDLFGKNVGHGVVRIGSSDPKIVFYEYDPLLGTRWEKTISDNFTINQNGSTVTAAPFFFSQKNLSDLSFKWYLDGEIIEASGSQISLKPSDKNGKSVLRVIINNINTLFQSMEKSLNVKF